MTTKERLEFKKKFRTKEPEVQLKYVKGDTGERGLPGKNGKDGIDGKAGLNGRDGLDGLNGKDGVNGHNGLDGRDGKDGKDGKEGERGARGPRGVPGGGSSSSLGSSSDSLTEVVKYTDSSYTYFSGYKTVGWQVNRWDVNTVRTIVDGTGTKPLSLAECQAQSYS